MYSVDDYPDYPESTVVNLIVQSVMWLILDSAQLILATPGLTRRFRALAFSRLSSSEAVTVGGGHRQLSKIHLPLPEAVITHPSRLRHPTD